VNAPSRTVGVLKPGLALAVLLFAPLLAALLLPALAQAAKPGDLDRSFGDGGLVRAELGPSDSGARSVAIDSHHRIVVAGFGYDGSSQNFALARYRPSGTLDPAFGVGGKVTSDLGGNEGIASMAIDSRGRIVAAGDRCERLGDYGCEIDRFALVRYTRDGQLDPSFGTGGAVITYVGGWCEANSVALDSRGRIVAAGYSASGDTQGFALARYKPDGELDPTFGSGGKVTTPMSHPGLGGPANSVAIDARGRIVVAGYSPHGSRGNFALARYRPSGALDRSFSGNGRTTTHVEGGGGANSVALDSSGRILVAGGGPQSANFALARYKGNGALDRSFEGGKIVLGFRHATARSVVIDSRGRVVVTGGNGRFALARYRPGGKIDHSFGGDGKVATHLKHYAGGFGAAIDSRDRIVVAGVGGLAGQSLLARYIGYPRRP
jgi:uncharacterized delta-60 repeat protein